MNNSNKRSYVELLFQFGVKEKIQRLYINYKDTIIIGKYKGKMSNNKCNA